MLEKSTTHPSSDLPRHPTLARRGLFVVFASTFLELIGVFMLNPLLLITLKALRRDALIQELRALDHVLGRPQTIPTRQR